MNLKYYFICAMHLLVLSTNCDVLSENNSNNDGSIINILRNNGNRTTTKLNINQNLTTIRRTLVLDHLMGRNEHFFNRFKLDDDSYDYSIVHNEGVFQLKDILFEESNIRIGENYLENNGTPVDIVKLGERFFATETLNVNQSLLAIRQILTNKRYMSENEKFRQQIGSERGSLRYSIVYDEELVKLKDILIGKQIVIGSNMVDISVVRKDRKDPSILTRMTISNINQSLDVIRRIWTRANKMSNLDVFFKKEKHNENLVESSIRKDDESLYKLKDIIYEDAVLIGILNEILDPAREKNMEIVTKFLNGYSPNVDGEWQQIPKKLATLKSQVNSVDLHRTAYESRFTSSKVTMKHVIQGINENSLSLSASYVADVSLDFQHKTGNKNSNSQTSSKSYCIARLVCEKKEFLIDQEHLTINNVFYEKIHEALSFGYYELQATTNLVNVLNEYGWYMPKHFILGGTKHDTKEVTVTSSEDAKQESEKFLASFKTSFMSNGAGASHGQETNKERTREQDTENTHELKNTIGGEGYSDFSAFIGSLSNPDLWQIIEIKRFLPSLKLLRDYDEPLFHQCVSLLNRISSELNVIFLQRFVDIHAYADSVLRSK